MLLIEEKKTLKMMVRDPIVSMYVATSGASGQLLGSDEKEIILLVYAVIDSTSNTVSRFTQI